ncbi:NADH-ubiquinone oxidoreductase chain E, partial [hydrothermal vent metagenome]
PQIIAASIALLVVFLLGCIIGWILRSTIFKIRSKEMSDIQTPSVSPIVQDKSTVDMVPENASKKSDAQSKPSTLTAPRDGKKDDLKKIKGVGPKLETTLNKLGIYHFDQIAGWTSAEIEWVDDYLSFKGRIERDDWISQAKKFGDI